MAKADTKGKQLNWKEHLRLRPDTYIGSIVNCKKDVVIAESPGLVTKKILYNSGLERIITEILSNAIDNKWRSDTEGVKMSKIQITASLEDGRITIWNDGAHISAEKKKYVYKDPKTNQETTKVMYPAEMYFGEMLAGTNFDDNKVRKTSGRNGMGTKATRAFSKEFTIRHYDPDTHKIFEQTYSEDSQTEPKLTVCRTKNGWTEISFIPDYEIFKYPSAAKPGMDTTLLKLIERHAYDCAMITGLNVFFNGEKIACKNLLSYSKLFYPTCKSICLQADDSECVLVETGDITDPSAPGAVGGLLQVSFVNGIFTSQGGVHLAAGKDAIITTLVKHINGTSAEAKNKRKKFDGKIAGKDLIPYFCMFVRCEIDKPSFDSQTKDCLNSPAPSTVKPTAAMCNKIVKWDFMTRIEENFMGKLDSKVKKSEKNQNRRPVVGDKADDANWAGTEKSEHCILFFTEGDSAKTFANQGYSRLPDGNNRFGAMALRGKFINVQGASLKQISENAEVILLKKILGLQTGTDYSRIENVGKLRYGRIAFLTDPDKDGDHIKGLLANYFYRQFPTLWSKPGFITSMNVPILRVTFKNSKAQVDFYSQSEFKSQQPANIKHVKYFKGLGTFTPKEANELFGDCFGKSSASEHLLTFKMGDKSCVADCMELAFDGKKTNERKKWLLCTSDDQGEDAKVHLECVNKAAKTLESHSGSLDITDFVHGRLREFHLVSIQRSIPSVFDGLKEGQRKVIFGCFNKNWASGTMKVSQLQGYIAESTGYHYGDVALQDTIVKMAQGFVGSNNIPLLNNDGMFGSRRKKGDDAAATRYIYTKLENVSYAIFPSDDFEILKHIEDDGKVLEPERYFPIIPMVLVNGAKGVATGFSTEIPKYNPKDLVKWIRNWLQSKDNKPLSPWFRGYTGTIESTDTQWTSRGKIVKDTGGWYKIVECSVSLATDKLKAYIEETLINGNPVAKSKKPNQEKLEIVLKKSEFHSTPNTVNIRILPVSGYQPAVDDEHFGPYLTSTKSLTNMVLLDADNLPRKFESPESIMEYYCPRRLNLYVKRKKHMLKKWEQQLEKLKNQLRFVKYVRAKKIDMVQEESMICQDLDKLEFSKIEDSYNYLLNMAIRSMSETKVQSLKREIEALENQISALQAKGPKQLWLDDLDKFEEAYTKFLSERVDDAE